MQRSDIGASPRENPLTGTITPVKETPYSSGEWKVVECQETGMVYLANPPDYSRLVEEFAWEKTFEEESKRRESFSNTPGKRPSRSSFSEAPLPKLSLTSAPPAQPSLFCGLLEAICGKQRIDK